MAAASSSTSGGGSAAGGAGPRAFRPRFGDTTLTKVFVGGLAWETPSEGLRQHFERYGDILEAVVITDRATGRSKGYGFVTFREPDAARRAVQDPNPMIAGRRANCNIASLGLPRPAQPRGRGPYYYPGAHLQQVPPPAAQAPPHFVPRAPPPLQMVPQHGGGGGGGGGGPAAIYPPSPFGYWYPPDFQYQQALANPQMLQNYYAQLYGLTSPAASPYQQFLGYVAPPTPSPRALLPSPPPPPPPQQQVVAAQPLLHHPAAQIHGSFLPAPSLPVPPSLPHSFRLQLPPPSVSLLPPTPSTAATDLQPADQAAASAPAAAPRAPNAGSSNPGA